MAPPQLPWGPRASPSDPRAARRATLPTFAESKVGAQIQWGPLETAPFPAPEPPSGKVTRPHLPPAHLPAGTFLAVSISAPLGNSVEIKRLFAVTNVANSDQTI